MPLIEGKSKPSFVKNLKTEIHAGKPMKQSLAIAYAMKKKAEEKKAKGGCVCEDGSCKNCMAAGGEMTGVHQEADKDMDRPGESKAGSLVREMMPKHLNPDASEKKENSRLLGEAKAEHHKVLGQMVSAKKPNLYAEGGEAHTQTDDILDRILHKRHKMAEGGMVANEDEPEADSMPAEFDDLVLDDHLESTNSGNNDGDMLGDAAEDHDRSDIIARIMKSRAKKDRMPRPA